MIPYVGLASFAQAELPRLKSSSVAVGLNEKYWGRWVWNKSMFVKTRKPGSARPCGGRISQFVDDDLWKRAQAHLAVVRAAYGAAGQQKRPRGHVSTVTRTSPRWARQPVRRFASACAR